MTARLGVWVYGITHDTLADSTLAGLRGVGDEPLHIVRAVGLAAVVAAVPLEQFGEEPMRSNLEDLDWLAATARAHDAVVTAMQRAGPTIPLRLATLYHDDDRVAALLAERHDEFTAVLGKLTNRTEWGVKAYGDRAVLAAPASPAPDDHSGTAYLLRRRAELAARDAVEHRAAQCAAQIHERLVHVAADGRAQRLTDPVITGRKAWMIHNGTYLVDADRTAEFAALVHELDAETAGVTVELTGPWPPYSFAADDGTPL